MKEKIIAFVTDVIKEMKKVTWPEKNELRDSTLIVLAVCGIISGFIYLVDWVVNKVITSIL
ncbi:MAG: preprotein translocase subunit SecE [Ignavibacteriae bacterium]|nr:preprotein translocase subunit SecE [Ignavibacteriota bacterium]